MILRNIRRGVKKFLYFAIFYSGLLHIIIIVYRNVNHKYPALILFYHRFDKSAYPERLLPYLDVKEFDRQLSLLKRMYRIIGMDEASETLSTGRSFSRPSIAITIDDGYLDNYSLAYPILRKHHLPALIYLTAGIIGTKSGLWIDDVEFALMHTQKQAILFPELLGTEECHLETRRHKQAVLEKLFFSMLKKGEEERRNLIRKLFHILNVDIESLQKRRRIMLNWNEVKKMSENGIHFGSHTLTHPFLPAMPTDVAEFEISDSKEIIEKSIGKKVRHFAIPNGQHDDFTPELKAYCKRIGFETVVTTEPGMVNESADMFSLKRVLPDPPLYHFACEIARYFLFSGLSK
jgi:peptidoglycan/xylan/chitin deacetylase (PgdA/CDA1 family)